MSAQVELFDQRKSARGIQMAATGPSLRSKTNGIKAMTPMEIDALEHASRTTMVWSPEGGDRALYRSAVLSTLMGMLAAFAALLFVHS